MRVMGCHHSSTIDSSRIWTNIQRPTRELSANPEDTSNQKPSKRYNLSGKQRGKRCKTYFEPCLLYVNEPGHSNYQLNDLGLYEQDIHLSFKKPLIKKRPKCKGLWEDKSFDDNNFDHYGEIKLIRSKVGDHDELGLKKNGIYQVKNILQLNRIRNASVTLVELRSWSDRTCWKGPWSKRSTEWDLVESRTDIPASTSEKDFHMPIEYFMMFMENVTLCNLIPEQDRLGSEERSNYITKIYSKWKGFTAGGLNYLRNPKYLIVLSEKGVERDGKVRLVLILEQTTQILNMAAIRVKLYKVHVNCDQGFIIEDMMEEGICLKRVTVTTSLRVEPGQYVIVPHTDREGVETEFMLAVYTPTPLPNVRPLSDGTAVLLTKGHTVSFSKAMKIDATLCHVNHLWGQWNLSDGQSRELHKSPQFEICITHIGAPTTVRFLLLKDNLQPEACTGVRIFKMSEGQTIPCNKEWLEAVWNDPVKCHDGSIEGWHWDHIAPTYCLQPGRYAVIAWADKTNYKCTFCLVAHSSSSIGVK